MIRGAIEKQIIIDKIKEIFPEAFEYDKVLRIPVNDIEIKVALTAAKDNVRDAAAQPQETTDSEPAPAEMTDEEKQNLQTLMAALNL